MKIAVVGAGASGLFVAGCLARNGHSVTVYDGNEKAGKKIYITGKGRCNLTNLCSPDDFLQNVVRGDKFLRSAIYNFTSQDAVDFFENLGLKTKVERGNRVFPLSDKASDVTKVLENNLCKGVEFRYNEKVLSIDVKRLQTNSFLKECDCSKDLEKSSYEETSQQKIFVIKNCNGDFLFDRVVVATGGKSYSLTGSTGDGYKFAKNFGHNIVPIKSSLCAIKLKDDFIQKLQGISLKNVSLHCDVDGKKLSYFGEMLFTDKGISGPIVLTLSSKINRAKKVDLWLDFKPALDEKQLEQRLLRDFEDNKNKDIEKIFLGLFPKAVAEIFANVVGLEKRKVNSIKKEERAKIVSTIKKFPLHFDGLYDIETAVVTSGGVDTAEINPKTFESKKVKGLYFVGEVLDVDALTGGFNLQIAWATAFSCAKNMK